MHVHYLVQALSVCSLFGAGNKCIHYLVQALSVCSLFGAGNKCVCIIWLRHYVLVLYLVQTLYLLVHYLMPALSVCASLVQTLFAYALFDACTTLLKIEDGSP